MILGCARISGSHYRYRLFTHDGDSYVETEPEEADASVRAVQADGFGQPEVELHRLRRRLC